MKTQSYTTTIETALLKYFNLTSRNCYVKRCNWFNEKSNYFNGPFSCWNCSSHSSLSQLKDQIVAVRWCIHVHCNLFLQILLKLLCFSTSFHVLAHLKAGQNNFSAVFAAFYLFQAKTKKKVANSAKDCIFSIWELTPKSWSTPRGGTPKK